MFLIPFLSFAMAMFHFSGLVLPLIVFVVHQTCRYPTSVAILSAISLIGRFPSSGTLNSFLPTPFTRRHSAATSLVRPTQIGLFSAIATVNLIWDRWTMNVGANFSRELFYSLSVFRRLF